MLYSFLKWPSGSTAKHTFKRYAVSLSRRRYTHTQTFISKPAAGYIQDKQKGHICKMASVIRLLKKRKELIPLVSFLSFAVTGASAYCLYSITCKTDVIVNKTKNPTPWENIDPSVPQKVTYI
ncbi:normal mucosa of esophagus-specific gene 1 protein-like [Protopterus annectens]|uniref:normal mucosa of esophagus-specific gene 1 protein-like n=1 Tax=Protopterus annectens TaxID=7888 RepID=UPI001CF9DB30|nr:normal mucosa of esophagus-specific gene 1 protein-like [Protopterus annectens]